MDRVFPDALLPEVLDFLDRKSLLLVAMPVSRFWRNEAVRHPSYWRDIEAYDGESGQTRHLYSIAMFLLRISRSYGRPINVTISLDDPRPLLETVGQHLSHIRALCILGPVTHGDVVLEALRCSRAPVLRTLTLNFWFDVSRRYDEQLPVMMPCDLLATHAPALSNVHLNNVSLPASPAFPLCLSNVMDLRVQIANPYAHVLHCRLPNVFAHCRDLGYLSIRGNIILDDPAFQDARSWNGLSALQLAGPRWEAGWGILQLPLVRLPCINLELTDAHGVAALAELVGKHLSVDFEWEPGSPRSPITVFLAGAESASSGLRRVDMRVPQSPPGTYPEDAITAFRHAPVVHAVARLAISLHVWDAMIGAGYLAAFPLLDTLILTLHRPTGLFSGVTPAPLGCPALQRLVLRARLAAAGMRVQLVEIGAFAVHALKDAKLPLVLRWEELNVDGSERDCPGVFVLPSKA